MKLTAAEIKLLAKILESKIERFELEDIINDGKESYEVESEVMHAIRDKLSDYLQEEMGD